MHRFIRLWRKTGWIIPELDLILSALKDAELIGHIVNLPIDDKGLGKNAVLYVAKLTDLQESLKLTVEELCAMIHQMPVSAAFPLSPVRWSDKKLFESLFDVENLFEDKESFSFHHYSLNKVDQGDKDIDPKTPFLLGGLHISEGDFIQALHLNFAQGSLPIKTIDRIFQMQEFSGWLKSTPFSVSELSFILKGEESNAVKFKINDEAIVELAKTIHEQDNLIFGKELLADIEKISKEDSTKIIEQMAKDQFQLIIATPEGYKIDPTQYKLTQDFSGVFNAVGDISAEVRTKETKIREKLNEFHPFLRN